MYSVKVSRDPGSHARMVLGLTFLFTATRLTHLTLLPVFNDEAVYLNWARMIADGEAGPFISLLVDNKKPLQIWLIALNMGIFEDPLAAGRFASVCAGAIAMAGIYFSGVRLFSPAAGLLAALAYILCPYTLLFDRQAQESSLLSACMAWSIWLSATLAQKDRLTIRHALALILTTGLGLLTLSTALLFVFLPVLFKLIYIREKEFPSWRFFIFCYGVGLLVSAAPYAGLYLTTEDFQLKNIVIPNTHRLGQSGFLDLLSRFPATLWNGLGGVANYFWTYLTPTVCLLAAGGLAAGSVKKGAWILPLYFFVPVAALLGTAGSGFSRYYVFSAVPLAISAGGFLVRCVGAVRKRLTGIRLVPMIAAILGAVFFLPVKFDLNLVFKPAKAAYVERDEYQFVSSQFSGYGVPEAIEYLKQQARDKKIAVLTTTNWGNPADAVYAYLSRHSGIELYGAYWVFTKPLLPPNLEAFDSHQRFTGKFLKRVNPKELEEVFFIRRTSPGFERELFVRANPNFLPVKFFSKPGGKFFVEIYKLGK